MNTYLLAGLGGFFKSLQAWLIAFGALGLFLIALLDAALIPIPGGPDVVVIALSHNSHALMPIYVIVAVIGSTIGSLLLYSIALYGGQKALMKFSEAQRERATRLVGQYDVWALLVASVLPPPFPFKIFVLSAGAFRMSVWRFIVALVVGRGFRFVLEGILAVVYGEAAIEVLKHHYPKIGLAVAAAILIVVVVNTLRRKRRSATLSGADAP